MKSQPGLAGHPQEVISGGIWEFSRKLEQRPVLAIRRPRKSGQGTRRKAYLQRLLTVGLALIAALTPSIPSQAEKLQYPLKKQPIAVRVVGRAAPLPISSFGANEQSFIVMLQPAADQAPSLAKLVYRFVSYDRDLPATFLDYDFVHKFRAARQAGCDERASALLYSPRKAASGRLLDLELSFEYARQATGIAIPPEVVLPCYVVAPADHRGSSRSLAKLF